MLVTYWCSFPVSGNYLFLCYTMLYMGIFGRLGNLIDGYINDFTESTSGRLKSSYRRSGSDPDLDAAYDELNDFLNDKEPRKTSYSSGAAASYTSASTTGTAKLPPEELRADFELLGVSFGANDETCKAAYKKLLKIHHPDRHAGHEGNYKKATERSAKINAAWDRIDKWRQNSH